ncbi:MAG TPA: pitrilysin family protein [Verrucomicrobiae bacterium]|nr:pitrilysin family protein [Verrucomicrobiae bacterium]
MLKWFRAGLVLLAVASAAAVVAAQHPSPEVRAPKLSFTSHVLSNGLRVILLEDHAVPIVHAEVWYHVGAKDERPGHTGFAHLFEHLMFKGSAHVGPDEHSRIIEAMGGFDNAATFDDFTYFYETFPSQYLARVLWLEADRMGSLDVSEANFESEREVVKEERRVRIENEPYGYIEEDLRAAAFTVHGYHHTPIGSMEDLNKATLADVRDFFNTYYKPNNATLILVGDFQSGEALSLANTYFDGIPPSSQPIPRLDTPEPPQTAERVVNKSYSNTPLPAVVIGYKIPPRYSPDYYPLDLASNILAGGESSRLYQALVYTQQIAVQSAGFGNFSEDPNLFWAYAILNAGHSPEEGEKAIVAVLDGLKTQPVPPRELQKAKNQEISEDILGRQTDEEKAEALGYSTVIGKDPGLVNTDLSRFQSVSAADIERVADKYFSNDQATVLLITPSQPSSGQGNQ